MKKDLVNRLAIIQKLRLALDHINIVVGFLAAGGKELPQLPLAFYATEYLRITDFNRFVSVITNYTQYDMTFIHHFRYSMISTLSTL